MKKANAKTNTVTQLTRDDLATAQGGSHSLPDFRSLAVNGVHSPSPKRPHEVRFVKPIGFKK